MAKYQKTNLLKALFFFIFFTNSLIAQNYIKAVCKFNSGKIINGEIKNDFKNDDEFLFFKENDVDTKINLVNITELIINDSEKYLSSLVEFHPNRIMSDMQIGQTSSTDFSKREVKQLLLRVLVEGETSLYQSYIKGKVIYFLKKNSNDTIEYLHYYNFADENNLIRLNTLYKTQLFRSLNCNVNSNEVYNNVGYNQKELINLVNEDNICRTGVSRVYNDKNGGDLFRIFIFTGIKLYKGNINSDIVYNDNKYEDSNISPNFGFELGFVLPNRKINSEVFSRFSYSKLNLESNKPTKVLSGITSYNEEVVIMANAFEISLGYRYYFNSLKTVSKNNFSFDISTNYHILSNKNFYSKIEGVYGLNEEINYNNEVGGVINFSLGTNYIYSSRYILELRYTFGSEYIVGLDRESLKANVSNFNFNFKYLIFQNNNNK